MEISLPNSQTPDIPFAKFLNNYWKEMSVARLERAFGTAKRVYFDDDSRFVLLSDCHRGDNSKIDGFRHNKPLFMHALSHYFEQKYTYIEMGDGDELWQNLLLSRILKAHGDVYALLHQFNQQERLHMLMGNHDFQTSFSGETIRKDGISTCESILLTHRRTGQELFLVHGHQADLTSWRFYLITRLFCLTIWRYVLHQQVRAGNLLTHAPDHPSRNGKWDFGLFQAKTIERLIMEWVAIRKKLTICGHTHLPKFSLPGHVPYFNTGSCLTPGQITGIEIVNGRIYPIRWSKNGANGFLREQTAVSRHLSDF